MSKRAKPRSASVRVSIETPQLPNFFRLSTGGAIPVSDLDDASIRGVARNWTALLLLKARNERKRKAKEARRDGAS